jgi:hypothetical protein
MTDDVFAADQPVEGQESTPTNDPTADLLASIVNEEGVQKYATIEDALKGAAAAQEFIGKLKEENQTFRSELDKRLSAEAVLKELKAESKPDEKPSSEFSPEAIQELVDKRLEAKTAEERARANEQYVQAKLKERYGDESQKIVQSQAQQMGLSSEDLRALSHKSPEAVLTMFNAASTKPQENVPSRIHPSTNSEATPVSSGMKFNDWQKLRRDNPGEYTRRYSEMLKQAEKMGESFYR